VLVLVAVVMWAASPTSGLSDISELSAPVSQVRYLFGVLALAAVVIAVGSTAGGVGGRIAVGVLGAAVAWNLWQDIVGDFPSVLPPAVIGAGLACGAAAAYARLRGLTLGPRTLAIFAAGTGAASIIVLTLGGQGYTERLTANSHNFDRELVAWLTKQPGFADGDRPVAMTPEVTGVAAGDSLQRNVSFIGLHEACRSVAARRKRGWVVLRDDEVVRRLTGAAPGRCLRGLPHARVGMYRVYGPTPAVRAVTGAGRRDDQTAVAGSAARRR
jgi:hypothetical protein